MNTTAHPLDDALARAAQDPGARPAFYRLLLESEVYAIGLVPAPGSEDPDPGLSIAHFAREGGDRFIPFFSSAEALQPLLDEETRAVALPARQLFGMTRGNTLVLNPTSTTGKEFLPAEIDALLGVAPVVRERTVGEQARVLLGQPAEYPEALVSGLSSLLAGHAPVAAAYLCLMQQPDGSASLVVGIEGEGALDAVMQEVGMVAADTVPQGMPVDLVEVRRGDGALGDYFTGSVTPFYQRT
ncbi:type III secretion system (T3SS) SseB-like protein [Luteimonas sp. J16]|jgi:hypothetical protein|uniref:enhanced serine sensitivity protein SseB C-terminal domain-containing protein n=1 Tax=unclassified Luteimonas TaxID=2629088 RepID=UPI0004BC7F3C|nr:MULTISPECIES: enhanced serine sensitivity protein SseB C-terminal domain-containing protein [unclassified Luteimonas]TWG92872.1 type III secretion system (T3SS) SseB-like protein [Luteimonas sp. J16]